MASAGLRRIVRVPPRVARDPEIPPGSNSAAIGKSSDRECSKRGISLTSGARTNPSQGKLDCAEANIDARLSRRGSGVWFNRRDSKSREPLWLRGFESPPLRHTVCRVYLQSGEGGKFARGRADSLSSWQRRERAILQIANAPRFLSDQKRFGATSGLCPIALALLRSLHRRSLVGQKRRARPSNPQGAAAARPIRSEHRPESSDARRRGIRLAALHRWIPRLLERAGRAAPDGAHSCR